MPEGSRPLNASASQPLRYAFPALPSPGEAVEVAPGVRWLRMPLPFKLDHINLWMLEDGDGWTIVDTGIARDEVKAAWEQVFAEHLTGRPLKRVIVTHFHPDHMGLAGWLTQRFGVELWTPLGEWAVGRLFARGPDAASLEQSARFYRAAGFDQGMLDAIATRRSAYQQGVAPVPSNFRRIRDGDVLEIGGQAWRVMIGHGHSPEHASLYGEQAGVLISGDQVLPRITPNISVWPQEPEANPLRLYLDSLPRFRELPAETLVLPSHDQPFTGLHACLETLAHHHDHRLAKTLEICAEPATGVDVLGKLFRRELDSHQLMFAIGESLAHLHFLVGEGQLQRHTRPDGVHVFTRS
jgi:glyoxylase-like metal-dependent hydrolase (beta-lactamase superfamily II)